MVTIYQTTSQSPQRGKVLLLVGLLVLCIAGGIWGFRRSRQTAETENLERYGIVVAPRPETEPEIVIDESMFLHVEPQQRATFVRQAEMVQRYYNGPTGVQPRRRVRR